MVNFVDGGGGFDEMKRKGETWANKAKGAKGLDAKRNEAKRSETKRNETNASKKSLRDLQHSMHKKRQ